MIDTLSLEAVKEDIAKHVDSSDTRFVNSLYQASNEDGSSKINILFIAIISVIGVLLLWANIAKIDELTRGKGKVIPSSKIQKVQYFDGGIVSEILVKEGQHIKVGQPLMKIDTTRYRATFEETQENLLSLKTKAIRLAKELNIKYKGSLPKLIFNEELEISAP